MASRSMIYANNLFAICTVLIQLVVWIGTGNPLEFPLERVSNSTPESENEKLRNKRKFETYVSNKIVNSSINKHATLPLCDYCILLIPIFLSFISELLYGVHQSIPHRLYLFARKPC